MGGRIDTRIPQDRHDEVGIGVPRAKVPGGEAALQDEACCGHVVVENLDCVTLGVETHYAWGARLQVLSNGAQDVHLGAGSDERDHIPRADRSIERHSISAIIE